MSWLKTSEHRIKAAVFSLFRLFFRPGRPNSGLLDARRMTRVLFLRPEKIGDMVISLPVFDALRSHYPHLKISVLASPRNLALIRNDPRFDRIFLYRKWTLEDFRQLAEIRRERFDCVFDMIDDDSVTTLFYSQLASPEAVRIGIGKRNHARFYDFNYIHDDGVGDHIIDNTLKLLAPLGIKGASLSGFAAPHITPEASTRVKAFLESVPKEVKTLIGLNLSAGKPNRIWPDDRAVDLSRRLTGGAVDRHVVVIVAPGERSRGEKAVSQMEKGVTLVPAGLDLIEVSALISRLDLLISPDTSLIHIARSFGVPVVGLYSRARKNFRRWQPYRQPDGSVVSSDIDAIHDITVDQVFDRVRQVLERVRTERA